MSSKISAILNTIGGTLLYMLLQSTSVAIGVWLGWLGLWLYLR